MRVSFSPPSFFIRVWNWTGGLTLCGVETGFDPQKLETGDDEDEGVDEAASEDSESSAGPLQTVTLTALLATLWCVVVLV